jgi:hypothetical protein
MEIFVGILMNFRPNYTRGTPGFKTLDPPVVPRANASTIFGWRAMEWDGSTLCQRSGDTPIHLQLKFNLSRHVCMVFFMEGWSHACDQQVLRTMSHTYVHGQQDDHEVAREAAVVHLGLGHRQRKQRHV